MQHIFSVAYAHLNPTLICCTRPPGKHMKWHCCATTKNSYSVLSVSAITLSLLQLFLVVAQQCHFLCLPGGHVKKRFLFCCLGLSLMGLPVAISKAGCC